MCGIVGYTGNRQASEVLINGLSCLEYRGYDSAGISVLQEEKITTVKSKGRLADLNEKLKRVGIPQGHCGIGHTRWATHGEPSDVNAHPHQSGRVSLVHNGIIENYLALKHFLTEKGISFVSQTDTEIVAKLIDYYYSGDPLTAIQQSLSMLEGSYALAILFSDIPDTIFAVRKESPLIIAKGEQENFVASDIPAILTYTRDYYLLLESEIAVVKPNSISFYNKDLLPIQKELRRANWNIEQAQKGGFDHFMLKEIYEQPIALRDTVKPRIAEGLPNFAIDDIPAGFFKKFSKIFIVACGTASYAGMVGKNLIEKVARIPTELDIASEFRYRNPIIGPNDLFIVISQSGETADSLAAMRLAKKMGTTTLAVVNVTGSSISREADYCIHTYAGPEIAVASTKAYSVQLASMYLIAMRAALETGQLSEGECQKLMDELLEVIASSEKMFEYNATMTKLAQHYVETPSIFFIGRGLDYALSLEGALKLKEISYIHCEAYAAGELKHGTISLVTDGVPVVAIATQETLFSKMLSNVKEVKSRGAKVLMLSKKGMSIDRDVYDDLIELPPFSDLFMPLLTIIPLQLLAYHTTVLKGLDVDRPRNLAKSVTVE